jgi:transmembrane sensor
MMSFWRFGRLGMTPAQWFARLKGAPITPRLDSKYRRWLAADPANEVGYERHELAWELAGELANDDEIAALLADAQRAQATPPAPRHKQRQLLMWSTVAATLAIVAIGTGIFVQQRSDGRTYMTTVGEQHTIVLPDRSRMVLNTSTRARVVYRRNSRVIELEQGEATFSVTHDPARPFEVVAAQGTTRALGTEFNVLSAREGVTVSVLSGTVEIIAPDAAQDTARAQSVRLTHGQELTYSETSLSQVRMANAARIQAWHAGRIAFENAALEQALAEFNRYTQTPVVVRDASLARLRVTGLFRIGETEALLRALDTAFGIRAEHRAEAIELRQQEADTNR